MVGVPGSQCQSGLPQKSLPVDGVPLVDAHTETTNSFSHPQNEGMREYFQTAIVLSPIGCLLISTSSIRNVFSKKT